MSFEIDYSKEAINLIADVKSESIRNFLRKQPEKVEKFLKEYIAFALDESELLATINSAYMLTLKEIFREYAKETGVTFHEFVMSDECVQTSTRLGIRAGEIYLAKKFDIKNF